MRARVTRGVYLRIINLVDEVLFWTILMLLQAIKLFKHNFGPAVTRKVSSEMRVVKVHLTLYQDQFSPQTNKTRFLHNSKDDWLHRYGVLALCGYGNKQVFRC
jgi:hypothetical protein